MKRMSLLILTIIFAINISGCGESMFEVGGNDKSPEAVSSIIIKAFMDKDYDKILSLYPTHDYATFSDEATHNVVAALLGKGGFDILNGVDMFLGDNKNDTSDIFKTFYSLIGISAGNNSQIEAVKPFFDNASTICNTVTCERLGGIMEIQADGTTYCSKVIPDNTDILDNNTTFVCTLSGGFGTVSNLSKTVETLAGKAGIEGEIDITTQAGIDNIVNEINKKSPDELEKLANELTNDELKDLANTLNTLDGNLSTIEDIIGETGAQEILTDFKGQDGRFSVDSLKSGLNKYLTSNNENTNQESLNYEY